MYAAYFGLTERPFSLAPDPRYLYLSDAHPGSRPPALRAGRGWQLRQLTGEVGTGKTTVGRALLEQPSDGRRHDLQSPADLLELLARVRDEPAPYPAAPPASRS